jgi:hypothetical protein
MLGVASSLVAVAALTIVFAGNGEAQGANGPNVTVVNTPLPVTGNVTATMSGNVSANIINPANNPVLIRNVDAQGVKELWQEQSGFVIQPGNSGAQFEFPVAAPAGKALVIENMHVVYRSFDPADTEPPSQLIVHTPPFGVSGFNASQNFVPHKVGLHFIADAAGKFYVAPGQSVLVFAVRGIGAPLTQTASVIVRLTGYAVDYP